MPETNVPLIMTRGHLDDIPEFAPPAGFSIRFWRSGDEAAWLRIHETAEPWRAVSPELYGRAFGRDAALLRQRQIFLLNPAGKEIGTATAWFDDDFQGGRWGRVHWVAVTPEWQGRGLSRPLMTRVCRCLKESGHDRAYLKTSSARTAALRLYLRFGFAPWIAGAEEEKAWAGVLQTPGPA